MSERIEILGVPVSTGNMQMVLNELEEHLEEAKRSYICVSNVHTTVMAHENPAYRKVQAESFLTLPDGKPLSVQGKKYGAALMEQVRGVDLMQELFRRREQNHYRHFFYGNTREKLETLIETLKKDYPGLEIAGWEPSLFRELETQELEELAARVKRSGADFLWVGLGAPRQEFFCYELQGKTGAVPVGVGGAFNVLAHIVPDAPAWMQRHSLEWLYRFYKEPRRLFKRYFVTNTKFMLECWKEMKHRKGDTP